MRPSRKRHLAALVLVLAAACGVRPGDRPAAPHAGGEQPSVAPTFPSPPALEPVEAAKPAIRMSAPDGNSPDFIRQVRQIPGVAAVAQVALAPLTVEAPGGPADLTVAAVPPLDYRPLAPEKTVKADFVWQSLLKGELALAHEEQGRLGIPLGSRVVLRGPGGEVQVRVGALAANGSPNMAGAMLSLDRARGLGVGEPGFLLVGVPGGGEVDPVKGALAGLPGAAVEAIGGIDGRAYLSGRSASRAFGSFRYATNGDGTISPEPAWVRKNIVTRRVPILGNVVCHRLMVPQLEGVMRELQNAGLAGLVNVRDYHYQGGCYVPRHIGRDPGRPLSMHAWGLAIDVNVGTNPPGARSRQDPRLVAAFERWGFRWGGRWSPPDAHHFELAALLRP